MTRIEYDYPPAQALATGTTGAPAGGLRPIAYNKIDVDDAAAEGSVIIIVNAAAAVDAVALNLQDGVVLYAKGLNAVGDGGGGLFRYSAGSVQPADGGLILAPTTGTGRLFRDGWTVLGFNGQVNALWFGVKADGTTDVYSNFIAAVAAAPSVKFPKGTYKLPFSDTNGVIPQANAVWEGEGKEATILRFEPDSAAFRNLIAQSVRGLTLKNLTVTVVAKSGQQLVMIAVGTNGGNLILDGAKLDGAMTSVGPTYSHIAHGIGFPTTGFQYGFYLLPGTTICGTAYGLLKVNEFTSIQSLIRVFGVEFHSNYKEDCAFNSPNGSMSDVVVAGCTFHNPLGHSVGETQYFQTYASIVNFASIGNVHSGKVIDAIHIEENCQKFSVSQNTGDVDGNAIVLYDNNISGVSYFPREGSILGNHFRKSGTLKSAGSYGIYLTLDASPEVPAKSLKIANNTMYGFDAGIFSADTLDDAVEIHSNLSENCNTGLYLVAPSAQVHDNTTKDCTVDIISLQGGAVPNHTFISATPTVDAQVKQLTLINPKYIFPEFSLGALTTRSFTLTTAGTSDGFYGTGTIVASAQAAPADTCTHAAELTWDGTTFTNTAKLTRSQGGATAVTFSRAGSVLLANVYNGAGVTRSDVRAQVALQGAVVVAV